MDYSIPPDLKAQVDSLRNDNPFDIRQDNWKQMLFKALGLLGTATGARVGVPLPKGDQHAIGKMGVRPTEMSWPKTPEWDSGLKNSIDWRNTHGFKGHSTEVPGNLNTRLPMQDQSHTAGISSDIMANMPGVRPAHSPLGSPQPKNIITEYLLGPNEGKGNFGTIDWMNMKPQANDTNLRLLKDLTHGEKFELALQDQTLKRMGHDPSKLSSMEKLKLLFPDLFVD